MTFQYCLRLGHSRRKLLQTPPDLPVSASKARSSCDHALERWNVSLLAEGGASLFLTKHDNCGSDKTAMIINTRTRKENENKNRNKDQSNSSNDDNNSDRKYQNVFQNVNGEIYDQEWWRWAACANIASWFHWELATPVVRKRLSLAAKQKRKEKKAHSVSVLHKVWKMWGILQCLCGKFYTKMKWLQVRSHMVYDSKHRVLNYHQKEEIVNPRSHGIGVQASSLSVAAGWNTSRIKIM